MIDRFKSLKVNPFFYKPAFFRRANQVQQDSNKPSITYEELILCILTLAKYAPHNEDYKKAAEQLDTLNPNDITVVIKALNHEDKYVCSKAINILDTLREKGIQSANIVIPALIEISQHKDIFVSHSAICVLGRWGGESGVVTNELIMRLATLLKDEKENEHIRMAAAFALSVITKKVNLQEKAKESIPALKEALTNPISGDPDENKGFRQANTILSNLKAYSGSFYLSEDQIFPGIKVKETNWHLSGGISPEFEMILCDLRSPDPVIREHATYDLGRSLHDDALKHLTRILKSDEDEAVRYAAISALTIEHGYHAVKVLIHVLKNDQSLDVRKNAVAKLANWVGKPEMKFYLKDIVSPTIDIMQNDRYKIIRDWAQTILETIYRSDINDPNIREILNEALNRDRDY